MKYLLLSNKHELLPFSQRLRREHQDVEVVVARANYERAWDGKARKLLRASQGQVTPENLELVIESARRGEVAVMTTLYNAAQWFAQAPWLWQTLPPDTKQPCSDVLQFGAWLTKNGELRAPHMLVMDWGAWPGGLGPVVPAAATLVRLDDPLPDFVHECVREATKTLIQQGFSGLFRFDLQEGTNGQLTLKGLEAGWHPLHTHAFIAELDSLSGLLTGGNPNLLKRFVTVVMLTLSPWPAPGQSAEVPIEGLTPQQRGSVWWHDVVVDTKARKLHTAGLDGRVGVAVGSAHGPELARAKALEICHRVGLPEKQFRPDAALTVPSVLASLEDRFGVLLG